MEAVAETGMTVVLSSHIVADLERVCDHLVILSQAHDAARRADRRDRREPPPADRAAQRRRPRSRACTTSIRESHTERQTTLLVRANGHVYDSRWELHEVDLEEIVLAYLGHGRPAAGARRDPRGGGA